MLLPRPIYLGVAQVANRQAVISSRLLLAIVLIALSASPAHQMVVQTGGQLASPVTAAITMGVPSQIQQIGGSSIPEVGAQESQVNSSPQNVINNNNNINYQNNSTAQQPPMAASVGQPSGLRNQDLQQQPQQSQQQTASSVGSSSATKTVGPASATNQIQRLPNINIYISKNEIKKLLGIDTKIHYVTNGLINTYPLGFTIPLGYNQSDIIFTWQNLGQTNVNYSISLIIGNKHAVDPPLINITRSGLIPKHEQVFKITLPCSGKLTDEVDVQVLINITGYVGLNSEDPLDISAAGQMESLDQLPGAVSAANANATSGSQQQSNGGDGQLLMDEPAGPEMRLVSQTLAIKRKKICAMHPFQVMPVRAVSQASRPATPTLNQSQQAQLGNRWQAVSSEQIARPSRQDPLPTPRIQQQQQHHHHHHQQQHQNRHLSSAVQLAALAMPSVAPPQLVGPPLAMDSVTSGGQARPTDGSTNSNAGFWRQQNPSQSSPPPPPPDPLNPINELLPASSSRPTLVDNPKAGSAASSTPVAAGGSELAGLTASLLVLLVSAGLLILVLLQVSGSRNARLGRSSSSNVGAQNSRHPSASGPISPLDKLAALLSQGPLQGFTGSLAGSSRASSAASSRSSGSPVSRKLAAGSSANTLSANQAHQHYHLSRHAQQTLIVGVAGKNRSKSNQPPPPPFHYKPNTLFSGQTHTGSAQNNNLDGNTNNCFYSPSSYGGYQQLPGQQHHGTPTADLLGFQCQQQPANVYHQIGGVTNNNNNNNHNLHQQQQQTRLIWSQNSDGFAIDAGNAYMPLSETGGSVYQTIA